MRLRRRSESPDPAQFDVRFSVLQEQWRKDPYRIGLMGETVTQGFLRMPTEFKKEFWIIEDEQGEAVARAGASLPEGSEVAWSSAYLGFFEAKLEHPEHKVACFQLFVEVENWARSQGATRLVGPLNFNTWFPYRFRVDHNDPQYFAWEPVNPPQYVELWQAAGFAEIEAYTSQCVDLISVLEGTRPAWIKFEGSAFQMREIREETLIEKDLPVLYRLSMEAFSKNFLFEPISKEAFFQLYVPLMKKKVDFSLSRFVLDSNGKEVAFSFAFMMGDAVVMKTLAVLDEAKGFGLSNALMHVALEEGRKKSATRMIAALVRKGAQSESYARKAKLYWQHDYALFSKNIGGR